MYAGEKFNSISHLVGAVLALMGFGALLTVAIQSYNWITIISFSVFGLTLVVLYTMSTLYHSFHPPKLKRVFQKLDHVAIYLLIAGTYTPYMMMPLGNGNGPYMLMAIWLLAVIGLLLDLLLKKRQQALQIFIYLCMGWACLIEYRELQQNLPYAAIVWLTLGGISYTVGIIFYLLDHINKLSHAHGIWHLFVLTGSICHFISVIGYVR